MDYEQYSRTGFLPVQVFYTTGGFWFQKDLLANQASENSSFIFTVCVRSVPRYHFKVAYVILQMAVKKSFKTDF